MRRAYGPEREQFGDFYPARRPSRDGAVVVIHGGFWRPHRTLDMTAPLAEGLARHGWNAWNVEYRRVGQGDWRATLADCAAAVDHLTTIGDLAAPILVGHSAGGQLAAWVGGRAEPLVQAKAVVALAGILDLDRGAQTGIGEGAVAGFLGGGPDEVPERYRAADPMRRLPTGVPARCIHSVADSRVPFEHSLRYVEAARRAGDDAQLIEVEGEHADAIDPETPAGRRVVDVLAELSQ
jgi:acetyl esterase/lipase